MRNATKKTLRHKSLLPRILSGLFLLFISILILEFFYEIVEWVKITCENYLSPDHQVGEEGVTIVKAYVVYVFLITLFLSIYLLLNLHQYLRKGVQMIIDTNKIKAVFLTDEICLSGNWHGYIYSPPFPVVLFQQQFISV